MRSLGKFWTSVASGLLAMMVIAIGVVAGPVRKMGEFGRAEAVKGYWASLQEFEKQKGR